MIRRICQSFEEVEIIFGREDIIDNTKIYFAYQEELLTAIKNQLKEIPSDQLKQMLKEDQLKLYVTKDFIAHSKIFLLSDPEKGTRVITGSANLSITAFSNRQAESIILFDNDEDAWGHFSDIYELIKRQSASKFEPKALEAQKVKVNHLPSITEAESLSPTSPKIEIPVTPPQQVTISKVLDRKASKQYFGLETQLKEKNNFVKLDQKVVTKIKSYMSVKKQEATQSEGSVK